MHARAVQKCRPPFAADEGPAGRRVSLLTGHRKTMTACDGLRETKTIYVNVCFGLAETSSFGPFHQLDRPPLS